MHCSVLRHEPRQQPGLSPERGYRAWENTGNAIRRYVCRVALLSVWRVFFCGETAFVSVSVGHRSKLNINPELREYVETLVLPRPSNQPFARHLRIHCNGHFRIPSIPIGILPLIIRKQDEAGWDRAILTSSWRSTPPARRLICCYAPRFERRHSLFSHRIAQRVQ